MPGDGAIVGVSDHGGWAVFVTIAPDGTLVDRRRVDLVDADLPTIPHHREAQSLPLDRALELIERVRTSAERHAARVFDELARDVAGRIDGVALRARLPLPRTVAERIADYRSRNVADWVMYRTALAGAAEARGWDVRWFEPKGVAATAARSLGIADFDAHAVRVRAVVGPPWNADHKLALAGAIAVRERGILRR